MISKETLKCILKELEYCRDCIFYDWDYTGDVETHRCACKDRWKAEKRQFSGDTEDEFVMLCIEYNYYGKPFYCEFYGTCEGEFKQKEET